MRYGNRRTCQSAVCNSKAVAHLPIHGWTDAFASICERGKHGALVPVRFWHWGPFNIAVPVLAEAKPTNVNASGLIECGEARQARPEGVGLKPAVAAAVFHLSTPQCSSGTTQSRRYPARAVKINESARHHAQGERRGATAYHLGKGKSCNLAASRP